MHSLKNLSLKGIIVPLVTPLIEADVLDMAHLHGLIDHVLTTQVNGIFILGTTGEGSSLSHCTRQQIIEQTCRYAGQRTAILVGITNLPLSEAVTLTCIAADDGADAVVLASPFFPITQHELFEYTKQFAQKSPLPVCLYNRPGATETIFGIDTLKELLGLQNIAGIKDSSGNMSYFKELIQLKKIRPGWSVLIGSEQLLAEALLLGADGGVTGGANLFPGLYVDLYHAAIEKRRSEIQYLNKIVKDVVRHIYRPEYLGGLKYALSCKQLCKEITANPRQAAGRTQKERIEQFLQNLDLPGY
jgi:dihydrodipicolinate synthase/N-acetylneuraminate lyase